MLRQHLGVSLTRGGAECWFRTGARLSAFESHLPSDYLSNLGQLFCTLVSSSVQWVLIAITTSRAIRKKRQLKTHEVLRVV